MVANRTAARARALAGRVGGEGVGMAGLAGALEGADAVIVSTGSSLPVLDVDMLAPAVSARAASGAGALVVVDVSVPRNVDPAVDALDAVELLDMDDLSEHAERALDGRRGEVAGAGPSCSRRSSATGRRAGPGGGTRRLRPARPGGPAERGRARAAPEPVGPARRGSVGARWSRW